MRIRSEFLRNVVTLMTGTVIAQAIPILISPVLSRLYSPFDFGLFALFVSVAGIISVIATGCYEYAVMLPEKDEDAINIVALSVLVACAVSVTSLIVLGLWSREISVLVNNPDISKWLFFVPLVVLFTGLFQSFNYWFTRKKQFGKLAASRIAQTSTSSGIMLGLGFGRPGVAGLVTGSILGGFVGAATLGWQTYRDAAFKIRVISNRAIKKQAVRYRRFPMYSSFSGFLNTASLQIPIILLTSFFSGSVAGLYYYSYRLLSLPMSLMGTSIGQVFFNKASEHKNDREKLKDITFRLYKRLLYIGVFPLTVIMFYGDSIFSFVLGSAWRLSGEYAQVLSPWILLVFISSPLSTLFDVLEKQKEELIFNYLFFIGRVASLCVGGLVFHDAYIAIALFGITGAAMWLSYLLYLFYLVRIDYFESLKFTLIVTLGTGGILFLGKYILGL